MIVKKYFTGPDENVKVRLSFVYLLGYLIHFWRHDIRHSDTQYNDTQHNKKRQN